MKKQKAFTMVEIMVSAGIFSLIILVLFALLSSSTNQAKEGDYKISFERDCNIFFEYLKKDLRSASRATIEDGELMLYISRLSPTGIPEDLGVRYQWDPKQITRIPEGENEKAFVFVGPKDKKVLVFSLTRASKHNIGVDLALVEPSGKRWAEKNVFIQAPGIALD